MTGGRVCHAAMLRFDPMIAKSLRDLSAEVAARHGTARPSDACPHVTLVPADGADEERQVDALRRLGLKTRRMSLRLSHIGVFPGAGVVYVGVTVTHTLLSLHREVMQALAPSSATPWMDLYGDGAWIPHCTLGSGLGMDQLGEAVRFVVDRVSLPAEAPIASVDLVEVRPDALRLLASLPFAGCTPIVSA